MSDIEDDDEEVLELIANETEFREELAEHQMAAFTAIRVAKNRVLAVANLDAGLMASQEHQRARRHRFALLSAAAGPSDFGKRQQQKEMQEAVGRATKSASEPSASGLRSRPLSAASTASTQQRTRKPSSISDLAGLPLPTLSPIAALRPVTATAHPLSESRRPPTGNAARRPASSLGVASVKYANERQWEDQRHDAPRPLSSASMRSWTSDRTLPNKADLGEESTADFAPLYPKGTFAEAYHTAGSPVGMRKALSAQRRNSKLSYLVTAPQLARPQLNAPIAEVEGITLRPASSAGSAASIARSVARDLGTDPSQWTRPEARNVRRAVEEHERKINHTMLPHTARWQAESAEIYRLSAIKITRRVPAKPKAVRADRMEEDSDFE